MEPTNKQPMQMRRPSQSASVSTASGASGKTPLERMSDALKLGRRGRMLQRLARHDRPAAVRAR